MSRAMSVAKEFVRLGLEDKRNDPLIHRRLQKLLYYAQAWSLVVRQSEMFPETVEAWRDGPVIKDVYEAMPEEAHENRQLELGMFKGDYALDAEESKFVRSVWTAYKHLSANGLADRTHEEDPWKDARGDLDEDAHSNAVISVEAIAAYFTHQNMPGAITSFGADLQQAEEEACQRLTEMPPLDITRLRAKARIVTPEAAELMAARR